MTPDPVLRPATYELTVAGRLGPVLRCALKPYKARAQTITILRTRISSGEDLVDLVMLLQSLGLKFDGVFRLDPDPA